MFCGIVARAVKKNSPSFGLQLKNSDYVVCKSSSFYFILQIFSLIKAYIDDPDYPSTEKAFRHFLADMYGFGIAINWEDML